MKIVSITLRLEQREITVSVEEAKELFKQLAGIFEDDVTKKKEYVPYPIQVYPAYPWWNLPTVIYNSSTTSGNAEQATHGGNTAITLASSRTGQGFNSFSTNSNSTSVDADSGQLYLFKDRDMSWSASSSSAGYASSHN